VNQLQFGLQSAGMVAAGMEANMDTPGSVDHDGAMLDYARLNEMTIQTWSPFQKMDWRQGTFIGSEDAPELNQLLNELAEQYKVTPTTIAAAWILRHPAKMQVITGSTKLSRIQEIIAAGEIELTRPEWYKLYTTAGHILP